MIIIDPQSLDGDNGFTILSGYTSRGFTGSFVSGIGDVNGDNLDDFAISSPFEDPLGRTNAGVTHIIYGSETPFSPVWDVGTAPAGSVVNVAGERDRSGGTIGRAGDVNDDGFEDFLVGASPYDLPGIANVGATYLIYGGPDLPDLIDVTDFSPGEGTAIIGLEDGDYSAWAFGDAGDINGDGIDDFLIDGHRASPNGNEQAGSVFVIFGTDGDMPVSFDLASLDGENGYRLDGVLPGDLVGKSVDGAGDFNGDGIDDYVVGAVYADPNGIRSGEAYVVFGTEETTDPVVNLDELDGTNGFSIPGISGDDRLGKHARGIGDFNDDGLDDIMLGAYRGSANGVTQAGTVYIIYGTREPFSDTFSLDDLDGTNGFSIVGSNSGDEFGFSFDTAGDFNGDGVVDVVVGAPRVDIDGVEDAGFAFVLFGGSDLYPAQISADDLDDYAGLMIEGDTADGKVGRSVAGNVDINQDGVSDIIVGSTGDPKEVYVIYGSPQEGSSIRGTSGDDIMAGGSGSDTIRGASGNDSLDGAGNDDLLVGDQGNDTLLGRGGDDTLIGGSGEDSLYGYRGNDLLQGYADDDVIVGDDGNDTLVGNQGDDSLSGGLGDDILRGSGGNDTIFGESGDDLAFGGGDDDLIGGDAGDDTLSGGDGNDEIQGDAGNDFISGGDGDDSLTGNSGNDEIFGEHGDDTFRGGDGDDTLIGGSGNDEAYGGGDDDLIAGDSGDDILFGGGGNDWIQGNSGNDEIRGEGGDDSLVGDKGNDEIFGGAGNDTLRGSVGDDTLSGGAGDDTLSGSAGDDVYVLATGEGTDRIITFDTGDDVFRLAGTLTFADLTFADNDADGNGEIIETASGDVLAEVDDISAATLNDIGLFI
jgi:Ca2+-binding RTX toxin-like protein